MSAIDVVRNGARQAGVAPANAAPARPPAAAPVTPITPQEAKLRLAMLLLGASFAVEAVLYLVEVFAGTAESRPYAINAAAKDVLFTLLALVAVADIRRHGRLVLFVVLGHVVIVLTLAAAVLVGATESTFPPPAWLEDAIGVHMANGTRLVGWLVAASAVTALMTWLYVRARRAASGLRALVPFEAEAIAALAEITLRDPALSPDEIARAVDRRWHALPAENKGRVRAAMWIAALFPLLYLRAPLALLDPASRRAVVERRLLPEIESRALLGPVRTLLQASIRFAMQLIYLGYYADPRSHPPTGYERFSRRERAATAPNGRRRPQQPLRSLAPESVRDADLTADVVVVGSGAGGSIVAHDLVERGYDVLVLERGLHVDPSDFTEDEADMYSRLYADGALQLSSDFTFQILQGMCVGGGTVVNNGVSFDLPPRVHAEWNGPGLDAGLPDPATLKRSFDEVRRLLGVTAQQDAPVSEGTRRVVRALEHRAGACGPGARVVDANLNGCLGCGDCNIGCRFGRKLSMLDGVLPAAQALGDRRAPAGSSGSLRVLARCRAERIERAGRGARVVRCRLGGDRPREVTVRARAVVVAAGAVHSSRLLMASGLGGDLAGRRLCANVALHMTGAFPEVLRSFEGLQISHYWEPPAGAGYMLETWFNPVMSQALVMPGWFQDHQRNMERYDRLACVGALVASRPCDNRVRRRPHPLTGAEIDFTPPRADLDRLLAAAKEAGRVLFDAGAQEVMPPTFRYHAFTSPEELDELDDVVRDAGDISVRTAHPQGGNPMSASRALGVVDPEFRVWGTEDVYVCDASVFPTAITVNPQLTVMALAHLAATDCIKLP
jgi:choline dehydrogenase-like flavoprotein